MLSFGLEPLSAFRVDSSNLYKLAFLLFVVGIYGNGEFAFLAASLELSVLGSRRVFGLCFLASASGTLLMVFSNNSSIIRFSLDDRRFSSFKGRMRLSYAAVSLSGERLVAIAQLSSAGRKSKVFVWHFLLFAFPSLGPVAVSLLVSLAV